MIKKDDFYVVEVRADKENAIELVKWLEAHDQKLDRVESTLSSDSISLQELVDKMSEHSGSNGFLLEVNFRDEEVALLAEMKWS